jgi:hypothetical protein
MLIILKRDEWDGLVIVKNMYDKPKIFKDKEEAISYCEEFEIDPYQLVDILL